MSVFGFVMMLPILINLGKSSATYGLQKKQLNDSIQESINKKNKLQENYNKLLSEAGQIDQELIQDQYDIIDEMNRLQANMKIQKEVFDAQFTAIKVTGIIFIFGIGLLLILKKFGILDEVNNAIFSIFKKKKINNK